MAEQRDAPQTKEPTYTRFQEWDKQAGSLIKKIRLGEEPQRIILKKDSDLRFEWYPPFYKDWGTKRENLELGKNIAYTSYETLLEWALELKDPQLVRNVVNDYSQHFSGYENFGIGENKILALVGLAGLEAQYRVFNYLETIGDPKNVSYRVATRIQGVYVNALLDTVEESLNGEIPEESFKIPPQLAPFLLEAASAVSAQMKERINLYQHFKTGEKEESGELQKARERIGKISERLKGTMDMKTQVNLQDEGWIFYSAARQWTTDPKLAIASHAPDFNWEAYFKGRDYVGGVLLVGEPIQFFSSDMATHFDELKLGRNWSFEQVCEEQAEEYIKTARRDGINLTYPEAIQALRDDYGRFVSTSCQEAWEKRRTYDYTEIWLEDPHTYALWVPMDWKSTIDGLWGFKRRALKDLLDSRPELPVILQDGSSLVSREEIYAEISKYEQAKSK